MKHAVRFIQLPKHMVKVDEIYFSQLVILIFEKFIPTNSASNFKKLFLSYLMSPRELGNDESLVPDILRYPLV